MEGPGGATRCIAPRQVHCMHISMGVSLSLAFTYVSLQNCASTARRPRARAPQVLAAGAANSTASAGRRLLDGQAPPLDAASAPALANAYKAASSAAASYPDAGVRGGLWADGGEWLLLAAAAATANVNQAAASAGSAADVEKTAYVTQTQARAAGLLQVKQGWVVVFGKRSCLLDAY